MLLLSFTLGCSIPPSMDPTPLDRVREEYMFAGSSVTLNDGKRVDFVPRRPFEDARGMPGSAASAQRGITVCDRREERGSYAGGGWCLEGGLLGKVSTPRAVFELYGKRVQRHSLSLPRPPHTETSPEKSFEFFLLRRSICRGSSSPSTRRRPRGGAPGSACPSASASCGCTVASSTWRASRATARRCAASCPSAAPP